VGRDDGVNAGEFSPIFWQTCVAAIAFALRDFDADKLEGRCSRSLTTIPFGSRKSLATSLNLISMLGRNDPFDAGSKFPGAGSVRIATATHFKLNGSDKRFTYINTHLDDQSDAQRRLGASLILWRAHSEASNGSTVIVTGDFNSPASGTDSGAVRAAICSFI
jgi:hypothetical protein